jgi:hypothetical protein
MILHDKIKGVVMKTKAMRRAERSARAVLHGEQILQFIQGPQARKALVQAAELGLPAVTAVSSDLQKLVGKGDAKLSPIKQYTGLCVRAVLEDEGFELVQAGVRVSNDPIFRTGSVYQRRQEPQPAADLLTRLIESLTKEELGEVLKLVQQRYKK